MRLDKYLKVSRLIRRRQVASDACSSGRISVNGTPRKPSYEVKPGDQIEISFGERQVKAEVLSVAEPKRQSEAAELYRIL